MYENGFVKLTLMQGVPPKILPRAPNYSGLILDNTHSSKKGTCATERIPPQNINKREYISCVLIIARLLTMSFQPIAHKITCVCMCERPIYGGNRESFVKTTKTAKRDLTWEVHQTTKWA